METIIGAIAFGAFVFMIVIWKKRGENTGGLEVFDGAKQFGSDEEAADFARKINDGETKWS